MALRLALLALALFVAAAFLPGLAQRYRLRELVYDPWRAQMLAKIAEATPPFMSTAPRP